MVVMLHQLLNLSSLSPCMPCFNKHEKLIYLTPLSSEAMEREREIWVQCVRLSYQISIGGWQFNFAAQQSLIQRNAVHEVRERIFLAKMGCDI